MVALELPPDTTENKNIGVLKMSLIKLPKQEIDATRTMPLVKEISIGAGETGEIILTPADAANRVLLTRLEAELSDGCSVKKVSFNGIDQKITTLPVNLIDLYGAPYYIESDIRVSILNEGAGAAMCSVIARGLETGLV